MRFDGEAGVDSGGLTKELFVLFFSELTAPGSMMFERGGGAAPLFLPARDAAPEAFEGVGRLLLKAVIEQQPVPLALAPSGLKYMLGKESELSLDDLLAFEPTTGRSVEQMLEMDDVSLLYMDFEDVGLPPREVTNDNRREFCLHKVRSELMRKRDPQLEALKRGFRVHLGAALDLFTHNELASLILGQQDTEPDELIDCIEFRGFPRGSQTPAHVKRVLRSYDAEQIRRFLRYVTAQTVLPSADAATPQPMHFSRRPREAAPRKQIAISRVSDVERFPQSHTCFNRLDLPDYGDYETVRERLEYCLREGLAGFGEA